MSSAPLLLRRPGGGVLPGRLLAALCRPRRLASAPPIGVRCDLRESYRILGLPPDGSAGPPQVREAYLRLAKLYHPDGGAATADAALFSKVEAAYRAVLLQQPQRRSGAAAGGTDEPDEERRRGAALQHRHYLSFDGVGAGTPGQRQRQYQQVRVDRAAERVLDYRQREHERAAADGEAALAERDVRQRSREMRMTQAVERLVEDLIQESVARGDFRNLSGAGKPLRKFQHDPHADPMTHNLNRILLDNGYQPPWVAAQRDLRRAAARLRQRLLEGRARVSDPASPEELGQWEGLVRAAREDVAALNRLVDRYNLAVPALHLQVAHYSLRREAERAQRDAAQHRLEERRRRMQDRKQANAAAAASRKRDGTGTGKQDLVSRVLKVLQLKGW